MNDLVERTASIGKAATQRMEATYIAREWWRVTRPGDEPIPVFFCPPQTQAEVLSRWYPGCGVLSL